MSETKKAVDVDVDDDDDEEGSQNTEHDYMLVWYDGQREVINEDPEETEAYTGRPREDLRKAWDESRRKNHHAFLIGGINVDPGQVRSFGPASNCHFPDVDPIEDMQEAMGRLMQASAILHEQQAALQEATRQLLELEALEDEEEDEAPAPREIPVPAGSGTKKTAFRPPGA